MPWPSARAMRAGVPVWARRTGAIALILPAIGAPLAAQTRGEVEWRWAGTVPVGRTVTIDAVRANVRVVPARGDLLEVSAVLRGRRDAPESVTMALDTLGGSVVIRTRYASYRTRKPARRDECLPPDTFHGNFWYSDVHADLTLRVPPGVRVAIHLMWGDIDAGAVTNPMELNTQNGSIDTRAGAAAPTGSAIIPRGQ